jgi:hypothetical protein
MFTRLALFVLLLLTACSPGSSQLSDSPQITSSATAIQNGSYDPSPSSTPAIPDLLEKKMTELAVTDLSSRLSLDSNLVSVLSTEGTVWPDAALGCPETDKVYAQAKVPGYRISLEADGQEYVYHTDRAGQIILCPEIKPDEPGLR